MKDHEPDTNSIGGREHADRLLNDEEVLVFIQKALMVCLKINKLSNAAAFFSFSGHVNTASITVGEDKKTNFNAKIYEKNFIGLGFLKSSEADKIIRDLSELAVSLVFEGK
jgi:hypothetical protein